MTALSDRVATAPAPTPAPPRAPGRRRSPSSTR